MLLLFPVPHHPGTLARIDDGEEGLYEFEWKITSGSCPPSADTVVILYKPTPGIPGVSDESRCGPGLLTLTSTLGTNGNGNNGIKLLPRTVFYIQATTTSRRFCPPPQTTG